MKKQIVAAIAFALSLASFAAPVKLATLTTTDQAGLVKAAAQAGTLCGNPMLGIMASTSIAELPAFDCFGATRDGENVLYFVYCDSEKLSSNIENALDDATLAILFPTKRTKIAFMASHPGCVEEDGVVVIRENDEDDEDEPEIKYTAFSEDGRWASMAESREIALAALAEIPFTSEPLEGDVARLSLGQNTCKILVDALDVAANAQSDPKEAARARNIVAILRMIESIKLSAKVSDAGIDICASVDVVPGSALANTGVTPFASDPFAFAAPDAIFANAAAANSGVKGIATLNKTLMAILEKYGIAGDYYTATAEGENLRAFVDVAKAVAFFSGPGQEALDKINPETFVEELRNECDVDMATFPASPATSGSLSIAGITPACSVGAVYASAPIPAELRQNAYQASVCRLYLLIKAALEESLKSVPDEQRVMFSGLAAALLPEGNAATICVNSAIGMKRVLYIHASADECRGIASLVTAVITLFAMMGM